MSEEQEQPIANETQGQESNGFTFRVNVHTLARLAQDGLVIIAFTGLVFGPIWVYYINAPISSLDNRVKRLEQAVEEQKKSFQNQDKSLAVIDERLKGIETRLDLLLQK